MVTVDDERVMDVGATAGEQSVRQSARRSALEAQAKMRAERIERERRLSALGVKVMVALSERDHLVRRCEERAGSALATMVGREGLSLNEAAVWCGPDLSRREAVRLRRLGEVEPVVKQPDDNADEGDPAEGSAEPTGPRETSESDRGTATGAE